MLGYTSVDRRHTCSDRSVQVVNHAGLVDVVEMSFKQRERTADQPWDLQSNMVIKSQHIVVIRRQPLVSYHQCNVKSL